jgi:hypothetical protein
MKKTTGMRTLPTVLALTLTLLSGAESLAAQATTTGAIRGRVLSEEGAPVPDAAATAVSSETGLTRSALTNSDGVYVLQLLPPGVYTVRVEMVGYGTEVLEGLRVTLGAVANGNVTLSAQAVAVEGITVTGQRREIDVSDGSVVQYVEREQIEQLPARGRDFTDFIALSGLVAPDPGETTGHPRRTCRSTESTPTTPSSVRTEEVRGFPSRSPSSPSTSSRSSPTGTTSSMGSTPAVW